MKPLPLLLLAAVLAGAPASARETAPDAAQARTVAVDAVPAPSAAVGPVPAATGGVGTALVAGWATYYSDRKQPADARYAAAGPLLRNALGDWRGKVIVITSGRHSTIAKLVDFCACGERHGLPTIADLSPAAFKDLAPLTAGIVRVEIELVALPATDTTGVPRTVDDLRMMREARDDNAYR